MARDRYRILDQTAPHFLTCTVVQWLPLFSHPANAHILLDALTDLQHNTDMTLYGYVIMENHCHLLAKSPAIGNTMASFKSFTARRIIDGLAARNSPVLDLLAFHKLRHKRDREDQVWQEGNHPELIADTAMATQKLEYIHNNPVKRGYVDDPLHWRYSSARNYAGMEALIDVTTQW